MVMNNIFCELHTTLMLFIGNGDNVVLLDERETL